MLKQIMRFLYASLLLIFSKSLYCDSIQQEPLNFGTLVIPQNNTLSSITINHEGETTTFGSIYVLAEGNPAELLFTGLPPLTQVSFNKTSDSTLQSEALGSNSAKFSVVLVDLPRTQASDEFGELLLKVGGRLITTGTSQGYLDGSFITDTQLEITIDY
ncbi:DUF4402 domain-containing protein [Pseudoalteromonas sp. H103]|uniref:DUF4402 domain-containing protein n=1 Tax=Pseudoalteromonas sp. H103 TaxID=1761893 RepID=UPI000732369D|nr:DUF4402 domain-containing protein [Pseudoalteromonas sp. H103]KTF12843.1 hypothetical protein ATS74_05240 [Pseudoalteromonas sp. H103]